jgi:hypothetical protein
MTDIETKMKTKECIMECCGQSESQCNCVETIIPSPQMVITELAQKLYNDDGHAGNVGKTSGHTLEYYELKAIKILGERNGRG